MWPAVTSEAGSAPALPATSRRSVTTASRLTTPTRMRPASRTRAATKPRAAVSLCRLASGNSTTAVPTQDSARATSRKAPHITPVVLPAPRTKSAWSRRGAYSLSVGIDVANVIRYSTPATRAVRRRGRADGRTVAGASGVLVIATLLGRVVYGVHHRGYRRCTVSTYQPGAVA